MLRSALLPLDPIPPPPQIGRRAVLCVPPEGCAPGDRCTNAIAVSAPYIHWTGVALATRCSSFSLRTCLYSSFKRFLRCCSFPDAVCCGTDWYGRDWLSCCWGGHPLTSAHPGPQPFFMSVGTLPACQTSRSVGLRTLSMPLRRRAAALTELERRFPTAKAWVTGHNNNKAAHFLAHLHLSAWEPPVTCHLRQALLFTLPYATATESEKLICRSFYFAAIWRLHTYTHLGTERFPGTETGTERKDDGHARRHY